MIKVYVAGPIRIGDYAANVRKGIDAGLTLIRAGFAPYIPHTDILARLIDPVALSEEMCLRLDEEWLLQCDCVLRLPGESIGADREVKFALQHKIPVFYDITKLIAGYNDPLEFY